MLSGSIREQRDPEDLCIMRGRRSLEYLSRFGGTQVSHDRLKCFLNVLSPANEGISCLRNVIFFKRDLLVSFRGYEFK